MAVKKLKELRCPFCGGTQFVKGLQISNSFGGGAQFLRVVHPRKLLRRSVPVIDVFCRNCGSLVRQYVQRPEELEEY